LIIPKIYFININIGGKLCLDVEENKTVDIDTSGPGAEIELEDNSTEENTSAEVETAAEETST
jgi:hypothetical protein